jgi:hypothetical protein
MNSMQPKKSPISIVLFLLGGVLVIYGQSLVDITPLDQRLGTLALVAFGLILVAFGLWTIDKG